MPATQTPSQNAKPRMNSSGCCAKQPISTNATTIPAIVPTTRHTPLPITAPCTGLITSSTVDAAEYGVSSSSRYATPSASAAAMTERATYAPRGVKMSMRAISAAAARFKRRGGGATARV
ncbi:MAG: hypothetical protein GAK33_07795 [Burkholderia lata]|uniref:Uncharacterized protein n=1 Tax=Burkholderia lata (strain ATCC 17760 / DSM 23089 / LMG 22485 / NCIMB 9086 / R18194 / 383) TaxID=482957 RepID=A0A833PLY6_BURL3|nr:MAG: hypothetical protein GAK33_07795 [Burkholderia lata]